MNIWEYRLGGMMFDIEREKCYAGIKKCDSFLKRYPFFNENHEDITVARVQPTEILDNLTRTEGHEIMIFHLKAKIGFIRRLVIMQEIENIAEYAKNDRG